MSVCISVDDYSGGDICFKEQVTSAQPDHQHDVCNLSKHFEHLDGFKGPDW